LAANKRKFPAKVLRRLKEHVYELVQRQDPRGQLYVLDLEKEDDGSKVDIVYGVGAAKEMGPVGYSRIHRDQLVRDIVFDDSGFRPDMLVKHTLPDLLTSKANVPVFKYLRGAGYVGPNAATLTSLDTKVQQSATRTRASFAATKSLERKRSTIENLRGGIPVLAEKFDVLHCAEFIFLLPDFRLTVNDLAAFLEANFSSLIKSSPSTTRKLVCLLDWFKYGPEAKHSA
jgi:hypothetical protein